MTTIADELKVLKLDVVDAISGPTLDYELRERVSLTAQILIHLAHMVFIDMSVSRDDDDLSRSIGNIPELAQHMNQESPCAGIPVIGQEIIARPEVDLAIQGIELGVHIKLIEHQARGEGRFVLGCRVP